MGKKAGKSAGWYGEPEEVVKNSGSVGEKKIVFVGASYKFVHKVLRDMLLVGGFEDCHLVVHDVDEKPMNVVADLLEKIARQEKTNVTVSRTLDRREALKGAHAVILSITTGGDESDWRSFEVCFKYGIPVGVGDTLGPTALARCLREVPVVVEIARDIASICPDAVMLNFTNPMSVITGVMAREAGITSWGLCHSADELFRYFAKVFHCRKTDIKIDVGGVNHQAFVTKLLVSGVDRTAEIGEATLASDAKMEDNLLETRREEVTLQRDIYSILGGWPSCGETHLAEFYKYFFTPRSVEKHGFAGHMKRPVPGREPFGRRRCPDIIHEWTYGDGPVGDLHLLTTEHAHELLWAYFTGEPFTRVLNLLNAGPYIKDIPETACVEALVTVSGKNVKGGQVALPAAIHSLVERWTTIHELSIRAALECDRDAARQALFLDPHVREVYDIAPMLEDMLSALRPWLPAGWFE
ncbi:MAG: hypothetical protein JW909_10475 [Planctomycetes bacterium]|nr:hypothetical protein [Planctomycetota bacterium]